MALDPPESEMEERINVENQTQAKVEFGESQRKKCGVIEFLGEYWTSITSGVAILISVASLIIAVQTSNIARIANEIAIDANAIAQSNFTSDVNMVKSFTATEVRTFSCSNSTPSSWNRCAKYSFLLETILVNRGGFPVSLIDVDFERFGDGIFSIFAIHQVDGYPAELEFPLVLQPGIGVELAAVTSDETSFSYDMSLLLPENNYQYKWIFTFDDDSQLQFIHEPLITGYVDTIDVMDYVPFAELGPYRH